MKKDRNRNSRRTGLAGELVLKKYWIQDRLRLKMERGEVLELKKGELIKVKFAAEDAMDCSC
jgi:hypothetical protein